MHYHQFCVAASSRTGCWRIRTNHPDVNERVLMAGCRNEAGVEPSHAAQQGTPAQDSDRDVAARQGGTNNHLGDRVERWMKIVDASSAYIVGDGGAGHVRTGSYVPPWGEALTGATPGVAGDGRLGAPAQPVLRDGAKGPPSGRPSSGDSDVSGCSADSMPHELLRREMVIGAGMAPDPAKVPARFGLMQLLPQTNRHLRYCSALPKPVASDVEHCDHAENEGRASLTRELQAVCSADARQPDSPSDGTGCGAFCVIL